MKVTAFVGSGRKKHTYHATEKGWFQSDYYYPVRLNPVKKVMGRLSDYTARKISTQN